MADINSFTGIGRLTKDAEITYTPGGMAIAKLSLAINRRIKKGSEWVDEVNYFDVQIFGNQAKNLHPYLTKGKQVGVIGYLKQERWLKDGQTKSRIVINAVEVQLLGGNKGQSNGYEDSGYEEENYNY